MIVHVRPIVPSDPNLPIPHTLGASTDRAQSEHRAITEQAQSDHRAGTERAPSEHRSRGDGLGLGRLGRGASERKRRAGSPIVNITNGRQFFALRVTPPAPPVPGFGWL